MYCIETQGLTHRFQNHEKVLDGIHLQVPKGAVYGFLGPNGAGKTTTLRLIPGLLKNALDYTEDMRSDPRPYFDGRAVGCVVCAEGIQAMGTTLFTLRSSVHALRGWPTPYSATINASPQPCGPDGLLREEAVSAQLKTVAQQVVQFAQYSLLAKAMPQPTA